MIKTKLFSGYFVNEENKRRFIDIDVEINNFLAANHFDLIDIKYSVAPDVNGEHWNYALMIYKELPMISVD
jgi:hypothetical protein